MESANVHNNTHNDLPVQDFACLNDQSPHHDLSEPVVGARVGDVLHDDMIFEDRFGISTNLLLERL